MKLNRVCVSAACAILLTGCSSVSGKEAETASSPSSNDNITLKAVELISEDIELNEENVYFDETGTLLSFEEALAKQEVDEKEVTGNIKVTGQTGTPVRLDAYYVGENLSVSRFPYVIDIQSGIVAEDELGKERKAEAMEALASLDAWKESYSIGDITFNYDVEQEGSKTVSLWHVPCINVYEVALGDGTSVKAVTAGEGGLYQIKIK